MILDTSFLIDLMKGHPPAEAKARELAETLVHLKVTPITVFEIWRGMAKASPQKKERLEKILSGLGLLPLNGESGKKAAFIDWALREKGVPIEPEDCLIAAIVLENRETLLTRNVKHFSRIEGLRIESY
ncbi:MAG TPA: PIN domain-containing protein [Candidatus Norongarragalinales archaeon]|nr:PIN domain-containing protein [Candidatus Norongarragalinales archaeon]